MEMHELAILLPLLLACGALAGLLAGLLGVGGGLVIVPMLYHVYTGLGIHLEIAMPLSVGTSLSTITVTSMVSARSHSRRGAVDWKLVKSWAVFLLLGVASGTALASLLAGPWLKQVFGGFLASVSVYMFLTSFHALHWAERLPGPLVQFSFAFVIGGLSAMLGIGGGTLTVPLLNLYSVSIHRAVANAAVFGFTISVPATLGYILAGWHQPGLPVASTGYVNWLAFAALVPTTILFAPLGVRLCHNLNVIQLKRVFAVFLFLVGLKMMLY